MQKVLVIGNIGSGKTTLCKKISNCLGLPAYHFDRVVWKANWQRPAQTERDIMTEELLKKDQWVIDGVSKQLMEAADTIIFLDLPRRVCAWRTLKRNIQYRFATRPEMPANCPDYKQISFITRVIWNFPRTQNPWILQMMNDTKSTKKIFHIRNSEELKNLQKLIGTSS